MGFITTKQASQKLKVGLRRIQILIKENRLPAMRLGRDFMIEEKDLELVKSRLNGRPKKALEVRT